MEKYDVVIIGAGPAGLRAAKVISQGGKKVIVLEKKSVIGKKVCAGGAFPKIFQLGIPEDLIERKFNSYKIHLPWHTIEIKGNDFVLATVEREKLGQYMAREAQKAGAKVLTSAEVKSIEKDRVILKNGKSIYFDYLIGADGGPSLVRRYLNLPLKFALTFQYIVPQFFENLEVFYDPKLFGAGYAWIFPYRNYARIGCGSDLHFQTGEQLRKNFHFWLRKMKINFEGKNLEGAIINYNYLGYQFDNIFLVGEAAGFVSGLSGAGIYSALISSQEIAKKILNQKYKPKIGSMLFSQKIQEKLLWIMDLNQDLALFFEELVVIGLFLETEFFNLIARLFPKK